MVMDPDGSLVAQRQYTGGLVRRIEEPGVAQRRSMALVDGSPPLAPSPAPRPSPQIGAAIEDTALRYASNRALRGAGLGVRDWHRLYRANIEVESAYRIDALSPVGAIGLGQLMPATARTLAVDPHDPTQNLDGSARYLLAMLKRFGTVELALAAYNAGPDAVERHGGVPPYRETEGHVRKVLAAMARLREEIP